jgi:hypothetical protein
MHPELSALTSIFLYLFFLFTIVYLIIVKSSLSSKKRKLDRISLYLLILGGLFILFSILSPSIIFGFFALKQTEQNNNSMYAQTGPLGDTLGGVMNPFIAIAGVIITGLAFYAQYNANLAFLEANEDLKRQFKVQQFESQLYKLLDYHRSNIIDMEFIERNDNFRGQKVLKSIITDVEVLFAELKRFFDAFAPNEILTDEFKHQLEEIKKDRKEIEINELARINLAYYIVFIGLSATDTLTLMRTLKRFYNMEFLTEVLFYFRLKPSDPIFWNHWKLINKITLVKGFKTKYKDWGKEIKEDEHRSEDDQDLNNALYTLSAAFRYYGGHQFRLSHYFRNLFYIFKLINGADFLELEQKKEYSKIIRSQLSTFELYLLFYNSVSKLGWNWEFSNLNKSELQLISKYKIIKNIPGLKIRNEINIQSYYPSINYEFLTN